MTDRPRGSSSPLSEAPRLRLRRDDDDDDEGVPSLRCLTSLLESWEEERRGEAGVVGSGTISSSIFIRERKGRTDGIGEGWVSGWLMYHMLLVRPNSLYPKQVNVSRDFCTAVGFVSVLCQRWSSNCHIRDASVT